MWPVAQHSTHGCKSLPDTCYPALCLPTCRKLALHKPTPSAGLEEQEYHEFLGGGQGTVPIINKSETQFPALAQRVIILPP